MLIVLLPCCGRFNVINLDNENEVSSATQEAANIQGIENNACKPNIESAIIIALRPKVWITPETDNDKKKPFANTVKGIPAIPNTVKPKKKTARTYFT